MAIFGNKEKETPKSDGGANQVKKNTGSSRSENSNENKKFIKFRLVDNGFNKAKIDMAFDRRDNKNYPAYDDQGRLTVYLEKKLKDNVILSDSDAAILNSQAVNSKIIYLVTAKQNQFDHPIDPNNKMFNIVNQIGK